MKRPSIILVFIFLSVWLQAQRNHFSFVAGGGPGYFFNDPSLNRSVNYSTIFGVNYLFSNKRQAVAFQPGIHLQANKYHTKADEHIAVHFVQRTINIHLDVVLKVSRKCYLRAGIFFNAVYFHALRVVQTNYNGKRFYSFNNGAIEGPYSGTDFQAGINAGLCFPFRLFNRDQLFGIQFNQIVSSLVNSDYRLDKAVAGADVKVVSSATRASMLLLTLEFNLSKKEKKKEE